MLNVVAPAAGLTYIYYWPVKKQDETLSLILPEEKTFYEIACLVDKKEERESYFCLRIYHKNAFINLCMDYLSYWMKCILT